jgi:hypothetical protein
MKTRITYSLLAAALACGLAHGQAATAYTTPVGYSTSSLLQGFNALGTNLQTPTLAAGNFENITSTTLTDSGVTYSPIPNRAYVLEITTSPATPGLVGAIFEVPAANISGSTITITTVPATDLVALGLTSTATYKLRVAPTLENIFTTVPLSGGGVLTAALSASGADVVWVPTGIGSYTQYYLRSGAVPEFRNVATNLASPNVPLIYSDGFFVQKKAVTTASLTFTGEVKTVATSSIAVQGINLLAAVAPVGLNLTNSGVETNMTSALSVGGADVLWVQNPDLTYTQYFRRSGTLVESGWRVSGGAANLTIAQAEAVNLSSGFLLQRKAASAIGVTVNVPSSYSSL